MTRNRNISKSFLIAYSWRWLGGKYHLTTLQLPRSFTRLFTLFVWFSGRTPEKLFRWLSFPLYTPIHQARSTIRQTALGHIDWKVCCVTKQRNKLVSMSTFPQPVPLPPHKSFNRSSVVPSVALDIWGRSSSFRKREQDILVPFHVRSRVFYQSRAISLGRMSSYQ